MPLLYTIGHSNRSCEEFLFLLHKNKIKHLIDIRTIPTSRHVPWSNESTISRTLRKEKIAYSHMAELGGLRHPKKNSINDAWRNSGFRGFADYMQTNEFFQALKKLNEQIKQAICAIMCAEAVPWRCHRSLIADAEIIRKINVLHIISKTAVRKHVLTDFAVVDRSKRPIQIFYPASKNMLLDI